VINLAKEEVQNEILKESLQVNEKIFNKKLYLEGVALGALGVGGEQTFLNLTVF